MDAFKKMLNVRSAENSVECSEEAFHFFDADRTGKITAENLVRAFTSCGETMSLEDAKEILKIIGGSETISLAQFSEVADVDSMIVD